MARLTPMSAKAIHRRFSELGWEIVRGSKHPFAVKAGLRVRLPNLHGSDVSVNLVSTIIRQAGISRKDWIG